MNMTQFKTAHVKFQDPAYNYSTSINPDVSDEDIRHYFVDKWLNLGSVEDDMQKCIECEVSCIEEIEVETSSNDV